jgi:hypothetical protein
MSGCSYIGTPCATRNPSRSAGVCPLLMFLTRETYWVIGQSIKDAARKKPTYIVEHSGAAAMRAMYGPIWPAATVAVKT